MKAVWFDRFGGPLEIRDVPMPVPAPGGALLRVRAAGLCRSDWHAWQGHDPDVRLPHVPGHELAGEVVAVGEGVRRWRGGERVTVPFACGCGRCVECRSGNGQVCPDQSQPGFTDWGAFAEFVAIRNADFNLVALPDALGWVEAASLGCRFVTAYRAVLQQGRAAADEWVAVFGCGGVGLAAIQVVRRAGAQVVAVDISEAALALARRFGAAEAVRAHPGLDLPARLREITGGGAHLSIDALGSPSTARDSVLSLRPRGRHVQVGLMLGDHRNAPAPWARVIAWELEILGSHGMAAAGYPALLDDVAAGRLDPRPLVTGTLALDDVPRALPAMGTFASPGIQVIDRF